MLMQGLQAGDLVSHILAEAEGCDHMRLSLCALKFKYGAYIHNVLLI